MKKIGLGIALGVVFGWAGGGFKPVACHSKPCYQKKVYIDRTQGLMWQDEYYTAKEDGAYVRNRRWGKVGSYAYAVRYCQNLEYAGFSDWRLPTSDELANLHRVPGQLFAYSSDGDFWTSTPAIGGKYYAVYPTDAYRYPHAPSKSYYIRCVRCLGR